MSSSSQPKHVLDLLPAYLKGSLSDDEHRRVSLHIDHCAVCQAELQEWEVISSASNAASSTVPAPSETVLHRVRARIEPASSSAREGAGVPVSFGASYLWQLLVGQIPLVRRGIWSAAPATIAIGCLIAWLTATQGGSSMVIALIAPALAAVSMSMIYGQENDPSMEIAISTGTSPRLILLARMTLVFGYDFLLALAGTTVIAATTGHLGLWPLVELWIGPMLFLSAFALAASLILGSAAAITGALVVWAARVFALSSVEVIPGQSSSEVSEIINAFWGASPLLIVFCAVIIIFTMIVAPRQERFA